MFQQNITLHFPCRPKRISYLTKVTSQASLAEPYMQVRLTIGDRAYASGNPKYLCLFLTLVYLFLMIGRSVLRIIHLKHFLCMLEVDGLVLAEIAIRDIK